MDRRRIWALSLVWMALGLICARAYYKQGLFFLDNSKGVGSGGGVILGFIELYALCPLSLFHSLFGLVLLLPWPSIRTLGLIASAVGIAGSGVILIVGGGTLALFGLAAFAQLIEEARWFTALGVFVLPVVYPITFFVLKSSPAHLYYKKASQPVQ